MVGAETMHRQMRRWLADLGHAAYADGPLDEVVDRQQDEQADHGLVHDP
jgi:hypothetical protein